MVTATPTIARVIAYAAARTSLNTYAGDWYDAINETYTREEYEDNYTEQEIRSALTKAGS